MKHERSRNNSREIAHHGVERRNLENRFENQVIHKEEEAFTRHVIITIRNVKELFRNQVRYASMQDDLMYCTYGEVKEGLWKTIVRTGHFLKGCVNQGIRKS